jgi:hypothetical protein
MIFLRRGLWVALVVFSVGQAYGQQQLGLGETSRFEFEIRRWRPSLESELQFGGNEPISPSEDLGVSDLRDNEYRGFLRFGRWVKVRGSYIRFKYQGLKTVEKDIDFAGVTFPEGTEIATSMQLEHLYAGAEVDILLLKEGLLAVVVDLARTDVKPILSSGSASAEVDGGMIRVQLLTLGLKGRVYLTRALALSAEFSGMKRGSLITDLEADVIYNLSPNVGVSAGYRNLYTKWVAPNEDAGASWRVKGYFFSGIVRF